MRFKRISQTDRLKWRLMFFVFLAICFRRSGQEIAFSLKPKLFAFIVFVSVANICLVYLISPASSLKLTRNVNLSPCKKAMQLRKLPREFIYHVNLTTVI